MTITKQIPISHLLEKSTLPRLHVSPQSYWQVFFKIVQHSGQRQVELLIASFQIRGFLTQIRRRCLHHIDIKRHDVFLVVNVVYIQICKKKAHSRLKPRNEHVFRIVTTITSFNELAVIK